MTRAKQWMRWVVVSVVCLGASGCAMFLLGAGAVGGYAVSRDAVNVKATTTEKLGFIGEKKGIAAEAVVLLVKV